jgi:ABC-type multidrug transport system fused ATPase/permease subunit
MNKLEARRTKLREWRSLLWKNTKRTVQLYWKIDKKVFISFVTCIVIVAVVPFVISYIWGSIINHVVEFLEGKEVPRQEIITLFIIAAVLEVFESLTWRVITYVERLSHFAWHECMAVMVPDKISSLDYEKFENKDFNNFMNKIMQGYGSRPGEFAHSLIWILFNFIQLVSAVLILFTLNPILLPIILVSLIPGFLVQIKSSGLVWGIWDTKGDANRLYNFTSGYLTAPNYIKEINLFGIKDYLLKVLKNLLTSFQAEQRRILNQTQKKLFVSYIIEICVILGIEIWLLFKVLSRIPGFNIGNFTFYRNTVRNFTNSSRHLFDRFVKMYENNLYMTDFFALMDIPTKENTVQNGIKIPKDQPPLIEFVNVSFKYPNSENYIYKNFSLTIEPGKDVALVGENGAGKTTFIKLLLRLYDVNKGKILVNGHNIKDLDLRSWYDNVGILFQDFNRYAYSIEENIFLGDIERSEDAESVVRSAKSAKADAFIKRFKTGYKQMLSNAFKDGVELSGGQWQRIALARAFFRSANVLVLDEPTSAIDAKGEDDIFKKIFKMQQDKTTIIISHRFSTVRNADLIYVIEDGQIVEKGNHNILMNMENGKYKYMFELQAEGYK